MINLLKWSFIIKLKYFLEHKVTSSNWLLLSKLSHLNNILYEVLNCLLLKSNFIYQNIKIKLKENSKNKRCSMLIKSDSVFSPVDALDPPAQVLTDVHGERVIVQLVHLLQVLTVEHLELAPLRHLLGKQSSFMSLSLSTHDF